MKEAVLSHLKPLIEQSVLDYIYWCDVLMGYHPMPFKRQEEWDGRSHGGHIRYTNIQSGQVVEAPYGKMETCADFDVWFWLAFVRSSSEYGVINELLSDGGVTKSDLEKVLAEVDIAEILGNRILELPEIKVGDVIQLRLPYAIAELSNSPNWSLKYYYEHRFKNISWLLNGGAGGSLPDLFGGVETKVVDVRRNEDGVIETLLTDLFSIAMPMAFQRCEFKVLGAEHQYKKDIQLALALEELAYFENGSRKEVFNPAERELNQIRIIQNYFIERYLEQ